MTECVPSRQHMSVMRERQKEGKLTGPERQATTALLLFTDSPYPLHLFRRQDLSLSPSPSFFFLAGWCHHSTPYYCPQYSALYSLQVCSLLQHQLPAHCHLIYSSSVGFLVGLSTHFPALVHWPSPQYTHPGSNGLWTKHSFHIKKREGNTHSNTNQYICVMAWYHRVITQKKQQHNLNVEGLCNDMKHPSIACLFK